jgi:hypothetical protein
MRNMAVSTFTPHFESFLGTSKYLRTDVEI